MYKVTFSRNAHRQFKKLPMSTYGRIFNAMAVLMNDPHTPTLDTTKLTDQEGYRLRVGDYRILYTIDHKEKEIYIVSVAHRKEAY